MSGVYTQGPGNIERDTTLRDLLSVLFKRKWLILGIFGVTTAIILLRTVMAPVSYSADATLLLNRQGARASVLERYSRTLPWVEVVESEVEVVGSTPVLQRAAERLRQPSEEFPEGIHVPIGRLARSIKTGVVGESNVLYVTGTAEDPRTAVHITNAVAESYVEYHAELFALPDAGSVIHARADSTLGLLRTLQKERANLRSRVGVTDLREEESSLIQLRELRRNAHAELSGKIALLRTEIADARTLLLTDFETVPFSENNGTIQGSSLMESIRGLKRRRAEVEQLLMRYTSDHPKVVQAQAEIQMLENDVRSAVEELISVREHQLRARTNEQAEVRRQIDELDVRLASMPDLVQQLEVLDIQIASIEKQYGALATQAVDSEINAQSFADYSVKILSPAVSAERNKKGDMVRLALGPILALMAGIGLAFYLENLDHSLSNREDVERHLEIPVLASFPDVDLRESADEERKPRMPYQKRTRKDAS